jgi:hypothetical protein
MTKSFVLAKGGALRIILDHSDGKEPIELVNFCTPMAQGTELDQALKELQYGDQVILTIIPKHQFNCVDSTKGET